VNQNSWLMIDTMGQKFQMMEEDAVMVLDQKRGALV
jgi:hypothetical protein